MLILYPKTERPAHIPAVMECFERYNIQIIYREWLLGMMHYFTSMAFDRIPIFRDLICIVVYVDRYPVTERYFKSILADMIFMPMRYDNAIDLGRI